MTADKFRSLALDLPATAEGSHMGHADFRVGGKVFASLGPNEDWGMVKLAPAQQAAAIKAEPDVFRPASGAWGRSGCTIVTLRAAKVASIRAAMESAWRNTAPKKLAAFEEETPGRETGSKDKAKGARTARR
jgi:hypothetical protein